MVHIIDNVIGAIYRTTVLTLNFAIVKTKSYHKAYSIKGSSSNTRLYLIFKHGKRRSFISTGTFPSVVHLDRSGIQMFSFITGLITLHLLFSG